MSIMHAIAADVIKYVDVNLCAVSHFNCVIRVRAPNHNSLQTGEFQLQAGDVSKMIVHENRVALVRTVND